MALDQTSGPAGDPEDPAFDGHLASQEPGGVDTPGGGNIEAADITPETDTQRPGEPGLADASAAAGEREQAHYDQLVRMYTLWEKPYRTLGDYGPSHGEVVKAYNDDIAARVAGGQSSEFWREQAEDLVACSEKIAIARQPWYERPQGDRSVVDDMLEASRQGNVNRLSPEQRAERDQHIDRVAAAMQRAYRDGNAEPWI